MHSPETIRWQGDVNGTLVLLDQTRLPQEVAYLDCRTVEAVYLAIKRLAVRGAPAIGVAAAYGVCLSLSEKSTDLAPHSAVACAFAACDDLATSRPTAVNLFWALDRMRRVAIDFTKSSSDAPEDLAARLLAEARAIHAEDAAMCAAIARHGADLLEKLFLSDSACVGSPTWANILTHCNAGALATGGEGTALAVIFELARRGQPLHVWVDETRPLLQGARLTAWELMQRGIDCTLICDSMAAQVMREGRVQAVIVGADRIATNGDAANKIGTYGLAVLAAAHDVPFYVAAPSSTIDRATLTGDVIPIEQRAAEEITHLAGRQIAPAGIPVYNPAFDVTPARLIRAIITERGALLPTALAKGCELRTPE